MQFGKAQGGGLIALGLILVGLRCASGTGWAVPARFNVARILLLPSERIKAPRNWLIVQYVSTCAYKRFSGVNLRSREVKSMHAAAPRP
jgi:hypothetical protein